MPDYEDRMTEEIDKLREARSRQALVIEDMGGVIADLRSQLAAMTERKDGWRRVAREYWWLVSEDTMRRQSIIRRVRRRREARNGHTD